MGEQRETYFLIGVGGIGMSSIARYLIIKGHIVYGYDKVKSPLVQELLNIGIKITFDDSIQGLNDHLKNTNILVVYSSAIPESHPLLDYYLKNGNYVKKRAVFLAELCKDMISIGIAGTHGKTTTSAILSHMFLADNKKFTAFIGGIVNDINSNLIYSGSVYAIIEADEFDRSFLNLKPKYGCITSIDTDHLDIYHSESNLINSFREFSDLVISKTIIENNIPFRGLTYGFESHSDYSINKYDKTEKGFYFNFKSPTKEYNSIFFNQIGMHNLSNALCALSLADQIGLNMNTAIKSLSTFPGVKRRMQVHNLNSKLLIDDYAHHPTEIKSVLNTIKLFYPNRSNCVFFQPHLFSRTLDFLDEFAIELEKFDSIFLLDIYPAREKPIKGLTSSTLMEKINNKNKKVIKKKDIKDLMIKSNAEIFLFLGAGDISYDVNNVLRYFKR